MSQSLDMGNSAASRLQVLLLSKGVLSRARSSPAAQLSSCLDHTWTVLGSALASSHVKCDGTGALLLLGFLREAA